MNRRSIAASAAVIVLGAVALTGCSATTGFERADTCTIPDQDVPNNQEEAYEEQVFAAMYDMSRDYVHKRDLPVKEYDYDKVVAHLTSALTREGCIPKGKWSRWGVEWEDMGAEAMDTALNYRYAMPADRECPIAGMTTKEQVYKELKPRAMKRQRVLVEKGKLTNATVEKYYGYDEQGVSGRWLASLGCEVAERANPLSQEWVDGAGGALGWAAYELLPEEEVTSYEDSGGSSGGSGGPRCRLSFSIGGGVNASCSVSTG